MSQPAAATDVPPAEVKRAQDMWHGFTTLVKRATVAIIIGAVLLAWLTL